MIQVERGFLGDGSMPRLWQVARGRDASLSHVLGWLREHVAQLHEERDRYGAVLLRGFDAVDGAPEFAQVLDVIARHLMDYVGGSAPREAVHGKVTSASQLPPHFSLALHQEMAYQEYRPDALALFCATPPTEGGETPIADAREVTKALDAALLDRFERRGLVVRRALPYVEKVGYENKVPRPWAAVLGTTDAAEAERIAAQKEWRVEWKPDRSMYLWQPLKSPFRSHPRTGERVWANQVHYHTPECMLRWALRDDRVADAENLRRQLAETPELLDYAFHSDGARISVEDSEHVWDTLVAAEIPLRWQRCDVLLIDNVLALHGRRAYRGDRRILVGLIRDHEPAQPSTSVGSS